MVGILGFSVPQVSGVPGPSECGLALHSFPLLAGEEGEKGRDRYSKDSLHCLASESQFFTFEWGSCQLPSQDG